MLLEWSWNSTQEAKSLYEFTRRRPKDDGLLDSIHFGTSGRERPKMGGPLMHKAPCLKGTVCLFKTGIDARIIEVLVYKTDHDGCESLN